MELISLIKGRRTYANRLRNTHNFCLTLEEITSE